jgi:hypothetical protein
MKKELWLFYPKKLDAIVSDASISLALLYLSGAAKGIADEIRVFDLNHIQQEQQFEAALDNYADTNLVVGINCLYSSLFPDVVSIAKKGFSLN